jgi:low affinity Fe/Cu permease
MEIKTYSRERLSHFAEKIAFLTGHPRAFLIALGLVILWALSGPLFGFSMNWQMVISTATSIITFLMVFLIQNVQNRDTKGLHLKLDELIRATDGAHTTLLGLDEMTDTQLKLLHDKYKIIGAEAREQVQAGGHDMGTPEVSIEEIEKEVEEEQKARV